ncbi:MAG: GTP-binding protein [Eubacteriales bacterium]
MDFYLITGFLGAGKTTFLKNFMQLFSNQKVFLLVNEFGKEGIDGDLVKELDAHLAEVSNGSIFCACKINKFEEELDRLTTLNPDVVIVEASGLSDPTNIRKILDKPEYQNICYKGSVCLVDGARFHKVVSTARVVPKQIRISSLMLLNKCDLIDEETMQSVEEQILELNPVATIKPTTYGKIEEEWLAYLKSDMEIEEDLITRDITLQKATIVLQEDADYESVKGLLNLIAEGTYRIKGFVKIKDEIYLSNCVGGYVTLDVYTGEYSSLQKLVALAGAGMSLRKILKEAKGIYSGIIEEIIYG